MWKTEKSGGSGQRYPTSNSWEKGEGKEEDKKSRNGRLYHSALARFNKLNINIYEVN